MSEQAAAPVCYRHPDRETWIRCQRCERPICPDCMNDAVVGFQCPSCLKEGKRSTRAGVLPYGGQRSDNPALTSLVIIGLNALVWLAVLTTGASSSGLIDDLSLLPQGAVYRGPGGGLVGVEGVAMGAWWQVLTSTFLHVSVFHIGFNMMALYFLGPPLEAVLGRVRFLAVYLLSALSGSAAVMVLSNPNGQTLGASGAIFGLIGALAVISLKVRGDTRTILMWLGINLVITFAIPHISWQGHLGGLAGGALLAAAFVFAPRTRRAVVQVSASLFVALAAVVAIVLRADALGPAFHVVG